MFHVLDRCKDFYMYLKVRSTSESNQRLFGSVHGKVFQKIYEELELLEPMKLKLELEFDTPLYTKVITKGNKNI